MDLSFPMFLEIAPSKFFKFRRKKKKKKENKTRTKGRTDGLSSPISALYRNLREEVKLEKGIIFHF